MEIVHVHRNQALLQLPHPLDRINARAHPVAEVRAGAQAFAAACAGFQDARRLPINRRGLRVVIVQGDVDIVGVAELLHRAERFGLRLGHDGFDPNLARELEHLMAARLVAGNVLDVIREQARARAIELQPHLPQLVVGQPRLEVLGDGVADLLEAEAAHERQAQRGGLLDCLKREYFWNV